MKLEKPLLLESELYWIPKINNNLFENINKNILETIQKDPLLFVPVPTVKQFGMDIFKISNYSIVISFENSYEIIIDTILLNTKESFFNKVSITSSFLGSVSPKLSVSVSDYKIRNYQYPLTTKNISVCNKLAQLTHMLTKLNLAEWRTVSSEIQFK